MRQPFRVEITPAFVYITDTNGVRVASMVYKGFGIETPTEEKVLARADFLVRALNRQGIKSVPA